jgi:hypothetical protein
MYEYIIKNKYCNNMQRSLHFKELYSIVVVLFLVIFIFIFIYIYKINKKKCAKYLLLLTIITIIRKNKILNLQI